MPLTSGTCLPLFHGLTHPARSNFAWLLPLSTPTQVINMMGENDTTRYLVLLWIHSDKPSNGQSPLACSVLLKCFSTLLDAYLMYPLCWSSYALFSVTCSDQWSDLTLHQNIRHIHPPSSAVIKLPASTHSLFISVSLPLRSPSP